MLSTIAMADIVTSGKYLRSRSPPNMIFSDCILSRGVLDSIGSSSAALDLLGCLPSAEIGMTLLTGAGAVSGFSAVRAAGGCGVLSCFGSSGMTGFMSGGVGAGVTGDVPVAGAGMTGEASVTGAGDTLGVTIDATGNGGSGCVGAGFGGSGRLTGGRSMSSKIARMVLSSSLPVFSACRSL